MQPTSRHRQTIILFKLKTETNTNASKTVEAPTGIYFEFWNIRRQFARRRFIETFSGAEINSNNHWF